MKNANTKAVKAKASKKPAAKKVNLAEVGKKKPGRKAKDESKKKNLVEVVAKKRGRKSKEEKAAEQKLIDKAAKKALKTATDKAQAKAPKKEKVSAYEWATANIKKPSDAAARKLNVGDVIETFYNDTDKPRIEVVVASADKGEDIFDVLTVPQEKWGSRVPHLTKVNTDMWRLIGSMKFSVKK